MNNTIYFTFYKNEFSKKDYIFALGIGVIMYLFGYIFLGFYATGLNIPFAWGGDGYMTYSNIKEIIDTGWFWYKPLLGAPYQADLFDFANQFLMNTEMIFDKFLSLFTSNYLVIFNIQFLFTIALCSFNAFIVLRVLRLNRIFSAIGSIIFSLTPYIFLRGLGHYCLAACYFVPFSVLITVWASEDDENYCNFQNIKSFFKNRKNLLTILFTFLIANNGIGYYPFFTCFMLCVVALDKIIKKEKISEIVKPFVIISFIVFFMLLALSPIFVHNFSEGANVIAKRGLAESEVYGLKIAQLFVPVKSNISFIAKLISEYNLAPLTNENRTSYLGLFGMVGFIISILFVFDRNISGESKYINLFSKLNIFSVLFFSIGGFIVLFNLLTGFRNLRGFNRISIFISFISVSCLCFFVQDFIEKDFFKKHPKIKSGFIILFSVFSVICLYELKPSRTQCIRERNYYKSIFDHDEKFIKQIENQMNDNDAIFCLPYHKYPEAGPVNRMGDYDLLTGYLHSSKLRWSYGVMKGRKGDMWNEKVSSLPVEDMMEAIASSGFKGIYIDTRAYNDIEISSLKTNIETIIEVEPLVSENGLLLFYNLNSFIAKKTEILSQELYDFEYPKLSLFTQIMCCGPSPNYSAYITSGLWGNEQSHNWSTNKIKMAFKLSGVKEGKKVKVNFDLVRVFNNQQKVIIFLNDKEIAEKVVMAGEGLEFDFICPKDGKCNLEISLPDAISPKKLDVGEDPRNLALALKSFVIEESD